uniref:Si:ch73-193i2.2 n=1 Tax=Neogobius melanostomus TaxID=47308 RepID=A0A8C6WWJ9_9GOBI
SDSDPGPEQEAPESLQGTVLLPQVDLDLLDKLISGGADPNSGDRFGQTVLHEISRAWSVDVMRFFLDRGSDLLIPDQFGVTALHVASALDYTLVQHGASLGSVDHKLRTPLQLAANMGETLAPQRHRVLLFIKAADPEVRASNKWFHVFCPVFSERSAAARVLLELGAEAGLTDADGQLCITALISHMAPEAELALSQFLVKDTMNRQQFYYLNLLEPEPTDSHSKGTLEVVVHQGKLELIMNPVFLKLIEVKWKLYGRTGAWLLLLLNFLFNVSWTTVAISVSVTRDATHRYVLPQDWWRILMAVIALLFTLEEILREVFDIWRSDRRLRRQRKWAQRRIHDDLRCCHPMWPQDQLKTVQNMRGNYSRDLWNLSDWLVYCLLGVSTVVHMVDVVRPSERLHRESLRLFSVAVIFLWLRLMKYVRAFRLMGPFIVMLGKVAGDVLRFLFLYLEIYIPYACSFWIIFGGSGAVPSMRTVGDLLFTLYRMTLVDEYDYAAMNALDPVMAPLLCGSFLAASSILCVNLLIAMVTDTFQRVHDNSQANAVMQQAAVVLQLQDSVPVLSRFYDPLHVSRHCAPLAEGDPAHSPAHPHSDHAHLHSDHAQITREVKVSPPLLLCVWGIFLFIDQNRAKPKP